MRARAKEIGADSLIEVEQLESTTPQQVTTDFFFGGVRTTGGERELTLRAKAIRYE